MQAPHINLADLKPAEKQKLFKGMNACEKGRRVLEVYRQMNGEGYVVEGSTFRQHKNDFNYYMELAEQASNESMNISTEQKQ